MFPFPRLSGRGICDLILNNVIPFAYIKNNAFKEHLFSCSYFYSVLTHYLSTIQDTDNI